MTKPKIQVTAAELASYIKRSGTWKTPMGDVTLRVKTVDARVVYSRLEFQVTPEAGSGTTWAQAQNVELDPLPEVPAS